MSSEFPPATLGKSIRQLLASRGIWFATEPELPPLDMAVDVMKLMGDSLERLGSALGLEIGITVHESLFQKPRKLSEVEMELMNIHLALIVGAVRLGYGPQELADKLSHMLASGLLTIPTETQNEHA